MSAIEEKALVQPKSYAVLCGFAAFAGQIHKALADGWQPGTDLPVILTSAIQDLAPVLKDVVSVREEVGQPGFAEGVALGGAKIIEAAFGI